MPREGTEIVNGNITFNVIRFENKMPREGTEIFITPFSYLLFSLFENKMPREGTEMGCRLIVRDIFIFRFENKMPREGTEIMFYLIL